MSPERQGHHQRSLLPRHLPRPRLPRRLPTPPHPKLLIADTLTLLNLISGFVAITYLLDGRLVHAAAFLALAVVFDSLDGPAARRFGTFHRRGAVLDSLADAVSFGMAPALLVYANFFTGDWAADPLRNITTVLVASAVFLTAILRLYRFTISGMKSHGFQGLPTPAMSGALVYICYLFGDGSVELAAPLVSGAWQVALPLVALLAVLMISEVPYPKLRGWRMLVLAVPLALALLPFVVGPLMGMTGSTYHEIVSMGFAFGFVWYLGGYLVTAPIRELTRDSEESFR